MTDFISNNNIHFNDFNDSFNYIVCIEETTNFDAFGEAREWNARANTVKTFEPEQFNEAINYAERLNLSTVEFPKGSRVSISAHRTLFDKII